MTVRRQRENTRLGGNMETPVDERAAESSQPRRKGEKRGDITVFEVVYEGCRVTIVPETNKALWEESMVLDNLFSTIKINSLELKNRAVMPAMGTGYGALDGTVTDRLVVYLERRARGGVGLIITEVCAVDPRGKGFPSEIGVWTDDQVPGLRRLANAIHGEGSRLVLQLHHAGRETFEAFAGAIPEAPSAIPGPTMLQPCEEMSRERIAEVVLAYASAARRARDAGLDAVEVHGAHGYLVGQFLSPLSNQREDEYGGSDENRALFAIQVLEAVRGEVGPDFPVLIRVSADELVRGGYDLFFMEWLAPLLVAAGADAIHASVGVYSTPGNLTIPSMDTDPGFNLPRARAIRQVAGVPVIGVGRITDPRLADEAIGHGDADLISFGRQHLTDPDFLNKARLGDLDDIRLCLGCNQGCIERLSYELKPITCTINPECGRESEGGPQTVSEPRRVWVVGAGPAGLSAAIAAREKGHEVEVFERESEPGGQLRPASKPPHKQSLADWTAWAVRRLEKSGVDVHLGREVTKPMLEEGKPDVFVLASGAMPVEPPIQGIHGNNVFDARDVLLGKVKLEDKAVVLGAGYVGMETADFLIARGVDVTVLEKEEVPPVGKLKAHEYWLNLRFRKAGGTLLPGATVLRIEPDTVAFEKDGQESRIEGVEMVVTALGALPESALLEIAEEHGIPCQVVGDALSPRRLLEAVHEGDAAGRAL
jgi:2,4-dienoyl-CoA reductase-like NADH-dependent reductase (Old Yellow Enzyme family)/thioredoxin reductase